MEQLFSEFKPHNASEWKNQLLKELKGDDYNSLRWHNENGFTIEPFYTNGDLTAEYSAAFTHTNWDICVKANSDNAPQVNRRLLQALNSGASAISLRCPAKHVDKALAGIMLNNIASTFYTNASDVDALLSWLAQNFNLNELNASFFSVQLNSVKDMENWKKAVVSFLKHKNLKFITVNVLPYHNLDCTAAYEVAIAISGIVEYLEHFAGNLPSSDVVVQTGISSDYFVQMAKLRALRRLWEIIKNEYNINNGLYIIAETGLTNKSLSDNYNNLLRTTVEAMAAVSGGCNELVVNEFDVLFGQCTKLSERMALNQQLILRHESYFDKIADVACGSYYIESLTDALASKALEHFKMFENQGGYFACIAKNTFKNEITEQAVIKQNQFNKQERLIIGVNKFRNEKETVVLTPQQLADVKQLQINNPALNFELQNFFNHNAQVI